MDSTIGAALSGLLGTIIALAVVLGLAWVSLRALRRWQDRGLGGRDGAAERQIRFVRALPVGQRERLVLIETEGELMLVGVTPGSISLLRNWGSGTAAAPVEVETPSTETIQ
jgi:flagellar protein FliO/FliZ